MFAGRKARLYKETTWTDGSDIPATPTYTHIKRIVDLAIALDDGDADVSVRESQIALSVEALADWTITAGYRMKQGADTEYDILRDANFNKTILLLYIVDGDIATSGTKGWRMPYRVASLGEDYPNADGVISNIRLAPAPGFDASGDLITGAQVSI